MDTDPRPRLPVAVFSGVMRVTERQWMHGRGLQPGRDARVDGRRTSNRWVPRWRELAREVRPHYAPISPRPNVIPVTRLTRDPLVLLVCPFSDFLRHLPATERLARTARAGRGVRDAGDHRLDRAAQPAGRPHRCRPRSPTWEHGQLARAPAAGPETPTPHPLARFFASLTAQERDPSRPALPARGRQHERRPRRAALPGQPARARARPARSSAKRMHDDRLTPDGQQEAGRRMHRFESLMTRAATSSPSTRTARAGSPRSSATCARRSGSRSSSPASTPTCSPSSAPAADTPRPSAWPRPCTRPSARRAPRRVPP